MSSNKKKIRKVLFSVLLMSITFSLIISCDKSSDINNSDAEYRADDYSQISNQERALFEEAVAVEKIEIKDLEIIKPVLLEPIRRRENTLHEGRVLYLKHWNFWVRAGVKADLRADRFFPDYENANQRIFDMIADIGVSTAPSSSEKHIWNKIRTVWFWMRNNVVTNGSEYATLLNPSWPSIDAYAKYYEDHGQLVWSACFSKAHLFASILGRVGIPRNRIIMASGHHTENGVPPTASHVFVGVYVNERWFYLDPTWVHVNMPDYENRASVGNFTTVDYKHPFKTIVLPTSDFTRVPLLPD